MPAGGARGKKGGAERKGETATSIPSSNQQKKERKEARRVGKRKRGTKSHSLKGKEKSLVQRESQPNL